MKDEEKLEKVNQSIPRNINQPIADHEIDELLAIAAKQVEGEKVSVPKRENVELKQTEDVKKAELERLAAEEKRQAEARLQEEKRKAQLEKLAQEEKRKAELEKLAQEKKEKAQLEKLAQEKKEKAQSQKPAQEKPKAEQEKPVQEKKRQAQEKQATEKSKTANQLDIEEPYVQKKADVREDIGNYKEKLTVSRVIANILETVWTIFKVIVLVTVVTMIAGVLLSREMMIRGRNGDRQSFADMVVASATLSEASTEKANVKLWLPTVEMEKLTLETDDGFILVARKIVNHPEENQWVVILHDYNSCMEDIYDIAMHYSKEGFNVLMPDLRAHGESEGSFIGMGWLDRLDVINWIDVILEENPSAQVVLHGVDIGADTALMLSGEPIKSNIKAIVAEGAYTSAWEIMKPEYKARHEKLPKFPFLHMMNPVMKVWAGYTLKEADAVKQVKKTAVPILLIRGDGDTYVTEEMTKKLDEAIASQHEVLTITGGTHGDCRFADSYTYYNQTFSFVGQYVK